MPVGRLGLQDAAWTWTGRWSVRTSRQEWGTSSVRESTTPGDEATLEFEGTGVAIAGTMAQDGGRADVWLDGVKAGEIDAWIPERTYDNDYWHVTGLPRGRHTVRIVVRGDADARSIGRRLQIERAIVYD
jgi:hypothetical protein